jgi:glc operon protein GlcG
MSLDNAKKVAAVALVEARKNNWFMAVSVVDPSGTLIYYEKMDDTQTGSANVSIEKAGTAALFKRTNKSFQDMVAGGGSGLRIPGLSGDSSEHDGVCAKAGADALGK